MRGSVFRRGDTWSYKFRGEPDPLTGKRPWISKAGFGTEKEAWRACRKAINDVEDGKRVEPSRQTVAEFLLDEWLPAIRATVKPSTWDSWSSYARTYVRPVLGNTRLQDVKPPKLMAFYSWLLTEGRAKTDHNARMFEHWSGERRAGKEPSPKDLVSACGVTIHAARAAVRRFRAGRYPSATLSPGLSAKTVRNVHILLHRAFVDAVAWKYLADNPAAHAKLPRMGKRRPSVWTDGQLAAFLEHASADRFYALYLLAATTGMRRGELCGLRWDAVDLGAATLSVRAARVVASGGVQGGDGKTENAARLISLDRFTVAALRAYKTMQDGEREAFGYADDDGGLVFTWEDGRPVHPDSVRERFARLTAACGLPQIRLHDVRHSYATAALLTGINPKIISHRLGHGSVAFTLSVYSHVTPGMDRGAADEIAALFMRRRDDEPDS